MSALLSNNYGYIYIIMWLVLIIILRLITSIVLVVFLTTKLSSVMNCNDITIDVVKKALSYIDDFKW